MDDEIIHSWCFHNVQCFDSTPSAAIIILDKDLESFSSLRTQQRGDEVANGTRTDATWHARPRGRATRAHVRRRCRTRRGHVAQGHVGPGGSMQTPARGATWQRGGGLAFGGPMG